MKNIFIELKKQIPNLQENVLLKNYTTFKIGGPAKYFLLVKTKDALISVIKTAQKNNVKFFILGGGSNLLVSEKGFDGLVIRVCLCGFEFLPPCHTRESGYPVKEQEKYTYIDSRFRGNDTSYEIFILSGASLSQIVSETAKRGLEGFSWAGGLPGTVGGTIFGNGQAFGAKISDNLKEVEALDAKTLKIKKFLKKQCRFSLKNSIFKKNKNLIILSARFELKKADKQEIKNKILEHIKYRNEKHPLKFPSAGSVFVNPEIKIKNKKLLEKFPELKYFNNKGAIPAGYLIEKCGLMGKQIGGAKFSDIHSNFIINATGNAIAGDVLALIKLAKQKVKKTFGINLQIEIQIL